MNTEEKIIKYLKGLMSQSEEASFLIELKQNAGLSQEVELFREILLSQDIFKPQGIRDQLQLTWDQNQELDTEEVITPQPGHTFTIAPHKLMAAAISIGIILLSIFVLLNPFSQSDATQAYQSHKKWAEDEYLDADTPRQQDFRLRANDIFIQNLAPDTVLYYESDLHLKLKMPEGVDRISLSIRGISNDYYQEFKLNAGTEKLPIDLEPGAYKWHVMEEGPDMTPQLVDIGRFFIVDRQQLPDSLRVN